MGKKVFLILAAAASLFAEGPAFEVASIRSAGQLNPQLILSGKMHVGMKVDAGTVNIGFSSLKDLIGLAYEVKAFQITGPDWLAQQRFDIVAKLPAGATKEQVPAMLQALLAERFQLKAHKENKDQNVYGLEVAKSGVKMKEAPPPAVEPAPVPGNEPKADLVLSQGDQTLRVNRAGAQGAVITGGKNGAQKITMGQNGQMHIEVERVTMEEFATMLTPMVDRPVVDRTGLKGPYQIALDLNMQDIIQVAQKAGALAGMPLPPAPAGAGGPAGGLGPAPGASDPPGGSIFQSIQQLGLRLEKQKAPLETLVVDSAEKNPTEN
jgi:uncharacterized protein (TIGR03435 family)